MSSLNNLQLFCQLFHQEEYLSYIFITDISNLNF